MILSNIKVYDLEESLIASGYPMRTIAEMREIEPNDWKRGGRLTKLALKNGAHGQWLTGVRVNFDVTFSNKAWVEAERYRFFEFVSSQSTMHRITEFDLDKQYVGYTDPRIIEIMKEKVEEYKTLVCAEPSEDAADALKEDYKKLCKEKRLEILYSNPAGFKLTARMTTNYRCLLNMYLQRHDHRIPEWRQFCDEILELPHFKTLLKQYLGKEINLDE